MRWRDRPTEHLFLAGTAVCLLGLHLSYVQLNDTYLVSFLPFALLAPAALLHRWGCSRRWLALSAALCLGSILSLSLLARGHYNRLEAEWASADTLLARGVALRCIGAGRHWTEYHGVFDLWLAEVQRGGVPGAQAARATPLGSFHEDFSAWLHEWYWRADYQVSSRPQPKGTQGWRIADRRPFRGALFQEGVIYTFERLDRSPSRPGGCEGAR